MAYTPGPWAVEGNIIVAVFEGRKCAIALVRQNQWPHPDGGVNKLLQEYDKANAKLISAAPKMLAACKIAREFMGFRFADSMALTPYGRKVNEIIDALDSAISDAEDTIQEDSEDAEEIARLRQANEEVISWEQAKAELSTSGVDVGPAETVRCARCGRLYSEFALDVVLPDEQWELISPRPGGGGVLCAVCIVELGAQLLGVTVAKLVFE